MVDTADQIREKITRAKTDLISGVSYDLETRPEVANLVSIYSALSGKSVESICTEHASSDLLQFKTTLIDVTVAALGPIRSSYERLMADPSYLDAVLKRGGETAAIEARETLKATREAAGLI